MLVLLVEDDMDLAELVIEFLEAESIQCDIAYNGVVSIEHEDLEYEGSVAKLKEGIGLGKKYLDRFFPVK